MMKTGEVVLVVKEFSPPPDSGYFAAAKGDTAQVLHVGDTGDEKGWVYVRRVGGKDEGWINEEKVKPNVDLAPSPVANATVQHSTGSGQMMQLAIARSSVSNNMGGYLSVDKDDLLEVLYRGDSGENAGWIYAQRRGQPRAEGWLQEDAVIFLVPEDRQERGAAVAVADTSALDALAALQGMTHGRFTADHSVRSLRIFPKSGSTEFLPPELHDGQSLGIEEREVEDLEAGAKESWVKVRMKTTSDEVRGWIPARAVLPDGEATQRFKEEQEHESIRRRREAELAANPAPEAVNPVIRAAALNRGRSVPARAITDPPRGVPPAPTRAVPRGESPLAPPPGPPPGRAALPVQPPPGPPPSRLVQPPPGPPPRAAEQASASRRPADVNTAGPVTAPPYPDSSWFQAPPVVAASPKTAAAAPPPPPGPPPRKDSEPKAAPSQPVVQPPPPPVPYHQVQTNWGQIRGQRRGSGCPGRGRVMELVTFGLENCDADLVDECGGRGGGSVARFDNEELRAALRRKHVGYADLIMDARCFPDPEALTLTRHTGHHPEIVSRISKHWNFRKWLWQVRKKLREAVSYGDDEAKTKVVVAVYCRAGKHRSVAASLLLQRIFKNDDWDVRPINHLSAQRGWGKSCKGKCEECIKDPDPVREDALKNAWQLWQSLHD
mmetsp:Transcript_129429/g.224718  ORF Transcript_129429/g.224718 Transcript_129429/m.224718 type:complete len:664 (+) Transcript_129429:91-2082(+)